VDGGQGVAGSSLSVVVPVTRDTAVDDDVLDPPRSMGVHTVQLHISVACMRDQRAYDTVDD
jgi:hypothetical protein